MAYDDDFYKLYEDYVLEPRVRERHDHVLRMLAVTTGEGNVADIGCGRYREFRRHGKYQYYAGYDANHFDPDYRLDYRDVGLLIEKMNSLPLDVDFFVSLFSTEITAAPHENREFYHTLFERMPSLKQGIVSGFYYASNKEENPVEETGGVVSWQTLLPVDHWEMSTHLYRETRITLEVPSTMFGEDVVEVWRLLERR